MRIAMVHFHLRPGGVTRVIENARAALSGRDAATAVITGEAPPAEVPGVCVEPALGYDAVAEPVSAVVLADRLERHARAVLGAAPDVWHIHNHSLGKNFVFPVALGLLLERGHRVVLQIHDFAEDGRPANYRRLLDRTGEGDPERLGRLLYPVGSAVQYAVLNGRDRGHLIAAGVPGDSVHLLPNPVWLEPPGPVSRDGEGPLYVYPTRAIRRKNLGEFLLLAAVSPAGSRFAVTLAPKNPEARPVYDRWVSLAAEWRLPVVFEYGPRSGLPFPDVLASAHRVVTTSVAEGFGLAYLEPWLAGRPLVGRNLPEVTEEFREEGVRLDGVYDRLEVPVAWVGRERLRTRVSEAMATALSAYGRSVDAAAVDCCLNAMVRDERVDVGRLDEPLQEEVIRHLLGASDRDLRGELAAAAHLTGAGPEADVAANRETIGGEYSLARYGDRLEALYARAAGASCGVPDHASAGALLDRFLHPARFNLLRT